jgi:ketosteroid isomerase-like protein
MIDQPETAAEVRELVGAWAKAVRERDIDGITAHHSNDFVMYDVTPPLQLGGIEAYRKTWQPFFENTKRGVFDIQELHVRAGQDTAFCFAAMRCEDKGPDGEYVPLDFRLTIGLKKISGQWTIVHEHHSVPSE